MNNPHDISWRHGNIFTRRRPVLWKVLLVCYVALCGAAFLAGVWSR